MVRWCCQICSRRYLYRGFSSGDSSTSRRAARSCWAMDCSSCEASGAVDASSSAAWRAFSSLYLCLLSREMALLRAALRT